ncbi:MAG: GtrA family protein, partial [Acidobacteria bacterium]|nr:GtrA family protein [Acidobacteriota bacterium]
GVQLAIVAALTGVGGLHYLVATTLAVETAILHNFLWHERWTWADRAAGRTWRTSWARLLRFNLSTGLISIGGNLLLMRLLVGSLGVHFLAANLLTITACSVANFLVSDRLVFTPLPLLRGDGEAR